MKNKKKHKYSAIALITVSALLLGVYPFYELRYTDARMDCFPYKVWFIDKTKRDPSVGDFIMFTTPANAASYVPGHKKWIKKILAATGGNIEVTPAGAGETYSVYMNGLEKKLPVKARVTVHDSRTNKTFIAFAADSLGRPLPLIEKQTIPAGYYYLYSPVARSYDSRYWGLVKKIEILGKAYPIL